VLDALILADITLPPVLAEVFHELGILVRKIDAGHVGHKEVRDEDAADAADGRDDERPLLTQMSLDGREGLRPNRSAGLANRSGETIARSSVRGCQYAVPITSNSPLTEQA
jgi:hypothetical protein